MYEVLVTVNDEAYKSREFDDMRKAEEWARGQVHFFIDRRADSVRADIVCDTGAPLVASLVYEEWVE